MEETVEVREAWQANLRGPSTRCKVRASKKNKGIAENNLNVLGVMRFLQTEWHRHERDRNAWEIERQEMKARIASLEGTGRRADISQATLKKYIQMLESTLRAERKKAKATTTAQADETEKKLENSKARRKSYARLVRHILTLYSDRSPA